MPDENTKPTPALPPQERPHHPFSPSTTQTLEASPCWIPRRGPGGEAAERGTLQHNASEREEDDAAMSDAEADAVVATKMLLDQSVLDMGPGAVVEKEEYLPIDDVPVADAAGNIFLGTTGGYADAVIWSADRRRAHVLDWKFGKYAVEHASNNTQGISYALGVQHKALKNGWPLESVTVTFFSPHIEDQSSHVFDREALAEARVRIRYIVEHAARTRAAIDSDPDNIAFYTPTTTGCLFCGRLAVCPAVREWQVKVAKKYKPLVVPEDIRGFNLTPVQAQLLKELAGVAGAWAKEVNARILNYTIENSGFIPEGYTLVVTHPRTIVNIGTALPLLVSELGPEVVYGGASDDDKGCVKLNITPAEEAAAARAPRGKKQEYKDALAAKLEAAGCLKVSATPVVTLRKKGKNDASGS